MRGRKPKPTAMKKLAGNPGKRALNSSEPQPEAPDRPPYAPRHLSDEAQKEWRRIVKALLRMGLYTEVDRVALEMYCQAYGDWLDAEQMVREQGAVLESDKGNFYQNPWYAAANREWEKLRKMLPEFGLTPSARSRLTIDEPEERDEFAELLFRRRTQVTE